MELTELKNTITGLKNSMEGFNSRLDRVKQKNLNFQISSEKKKNVLGVSKVEGGEGNGSPLQYSCLANPMDGGAW